MTSSIGLRHLIFEAAVDMGLTLTTSEIAQLAHLVTVKAAQRDQRTQIPSLPPRLSQTLQGLAAGENRAETAARMVVTLDAVRTHRIRLYKRLGARTGAHAVAIGAQYGLLKPIGGGR